ncbi:MAG: hypothetical protein AAF289_19675, partial [Cyanobacteria bacterium P01_A01_bin.135]
MRKFAALLALLALTACQADTTTDAGTDADTADTGDLPGAGVTIRSANTDWLEEQFTTEIVNIGLAELGYELEDIRQVDYAALHVSVAN